MRGFAIPLAHMGRSVVRLAHISMYRAWTTAPSTAATAAVRTRTVIIATYGGRTARVGAARWQHTFTIIAIGIHIFTGTLTSSW